MDSDGAVYLWTYQSGAGQYRAVSGAFSAGQWTHLVIARQGSSASIYLNGVNKTTSGTSLINPTACGATSAEISNSYGPDAFPGFIDDVKIYNYARTPAQIAWDYNRGKPVGWWKFDECQGTTAHDSSGNGNTGTITIGGSGSQTTAGTCLSQSMEQAPGTTGNPENIIPR